MALIHEKLVAINRDIEAIEKARRNRDQGNAYRGIDDVYNAVHELLAKHGVLTVPHVVEERETERVSCKGTAMTQRLVRMAYHWTAEDGSEVVSESLGEGLDTSDKAAGKAQSYAHKTAILQMFCVPTEDAQPDADAEAPEALADPLLTLSERSELMTRATAAGVTVAEVAERIRTEFRVTSSKELRQSQAVKLLEWLDSRKAETEGGAE